jgi:magnesium transporter
MSPAGDAGRPSTAGDLAVAGPSLRPTETAGEARARLLGAPAGAASDLAACEADGRFVGLVPLERLLAARDAEQVVDLMVAPGAVVGRDVGREAAAAAASRAGRRTVAVVDQAGGLVGLIPPERLIGILADEHEEDLARIGGFVAATSRARTAAEEPVGRRLLHRLPWLGLGLAGAMASTAIVGWFEDDLRRVVLLAFFVPAVVYMADAVGTQTETVVIRGMSLGIPLGRIAARELATGMVMGALIGGLFLPFSLLVWGDSRVAGVVALALFVSCSIATIVAMALPYGLARLGRDPAFGSGPLATVIQDLLSIVVYFGFASALVD